MFASTHRSCSSYNETLFVSFTGPVRDVTNKHIGSGQFQFLNDVLTRFSIDDHHDDGVLHGEQVHEPQENQAMLRTRSIHKL